MTATIHALEGNASPRLVMAVRQDNIVGHLERMHKTLIVSLVSVIFDSLYISLLWHIILLLFYDYYTITVNLFNGHFCRDRDYLSPGLAHFALHTVTFAFMSFIPLLHEAGLLNETWFVARQVWFVGGTMCDIITIQLVLQQWCKMSNLRSGVLPLLFGRWGEKDAWYIYFARCLPIVQNLDFCLIGQKQKILWSPALIGQGTYLTSGVITGFEINFFVREPAGN